MQYTTLMYLFMIMLCLFLVSVLVSCFNLHVLPIFVYVAYNYSAIVIGLNLSFGSSTMLDHSRFWTLCSIWSPCGQGI